MCIYDKVIEEFKIIGTIPVKVDSHYGAKEQNFSVRVTRSPVVIVVYTSKRNEDKTEHNNKIMM